MTSLTGPFRGISRGERCSSQYEPLPAGITQHEGVEMSTPLTTAQVAHAAEHAVQRVADASVWLLFRLDGVRS